LFEGLMTQAMGGFLGRKSAIRGGLATGVHVTGINALLN
jgi:hypothetical protein